MNLWPNRNSNRSSNRNRNERHVGDTRPASSRPPLTSARAAAALALLACVAILATACAGPSANANANSGGTPTPEATTATTAPTPTPTPTPAPRVLYTADWSHGAGGWTLPPHWSIQDGQLVNDGQGEDAIPIPFAFTQQRYTVEMQAQVSGYTCPGSCNEYGFAATGANGSHLYVAEIDEIDMNPPHHGFSMLTSPHPEDPKYAVATQDFIPGVNVRSYTVSVDGDTASFAISDSGVGSVTTTLPLAPATLSITDHHVQLAISSLTITTP